MTYRESVTTEEEIANLVMNKALSGTQTTVENSQLRALKSLADQTDPTFLAKLAVYAYETGKVRDSSAWLLAYLSSHTELFKAIAPRILNNMGQIRKFVYFKRNGLAGESRSLGTAPRRFIANYINSLSATDLFFQSQGGTPSTADIMRLTHARPENHLDLMIKYLMGFEVNEDQLPQELRDYRTYMNNPAEFDGLPDVPVRMLSATVSQMTPDQVTDYIAKLSPNQLRRELNLLARRNAWGDRRNIELAVAKLRSFNKVRGATIFPMSLWITTQSLEPNVPNEIRLTLEQQLSDTLENASENLNKLFTMPTTIALDCSGSMMGSYDGKHPWQGGVTANSIYTMGALFMFPFRNNPNVQLGVVNTQWRPIDMRDNNLKNYMVDMGRLVGGGTALSEVIRNTDTELTIIISDNETWADRRAFGQIWRDPKNADKRLILWDITPRVQTPATTNEQTFNVGGISEGVYQTIELFLKGVSLLDQIKATDLRL